jgi:aryl-alcohol dehydrogenase-like predicted oxidoreductase
MMWGEQNDEKQAHQQLDYAVERGVNFIDTAELYAIPPKPETRGRSEKIIGSWLAERNNRDKVVIGSKVVGRFDDAVWMRPDGQPPRHTKAQIDFAIERSLKALQTDYIDLYQIHWPDRLYQAFGYHTFVDHGIDDMVPMEETLEALSRHVEAGRIRALGLSNETPWGTMKFLQLAEKHGWPRMSSIQNAFSLLNRRFDYGLAEIAMREDIGLIAYSPLGQGYLTGKYANGAMPKGTRKTLFGRLERYEGPGSQEAIDEAMKLAAEYNITPVQLALKFIDSRPFVTSNLFGASSMDQLKENIDAHEIEWTPEMEKAVHKFHVKYRSPCP